MNVTEPEETFDICQMRRSKPSNPPCKVLFPVQGFCWSSLRDAHFIEITFVSGDEEFVWTGCIFADRDSKGSISDSVSIPDTHPQESTNSSKISGSPNLPTIGPK